MDDDMKFLVSEEDRDHGLIWGISSYKTFLLIAFFQQCL